MKKIQLSYLMLFFLFGCEGEKKEIYTTPEPVVVVLGQDVSKSFVGFNEFNSQDINLICEAAEKSGREIVIAFGTIGNPTDSILVRCVIHSKPLEDQEVTLSQRAKTHTNASKIKKSNLIAITDFIKKVKSLTVRQLEQSTDINGFLEKSNRLFSEPQFNDYTKILYANTDGSHSVGSDTTLVCNISKDVQIYVSGWKNKHNISTGHPLESSKGFVNYLSNYLNK